MLLIRADLDEIDAGAGDDAVNEIYEDSPSHRSQSGGQFAEVRGKLQFDGHITLRSQQSPVPLASLGDSFHTQLSIWLAKELPNLDTSLLCAVNLGPGDLVSDLHACYLSILDTV